MVAFLPGGLLGLLLLLVALLFRGRGLGAALFFAGATYVSAVAAADGRTDGSAAVVAVLLLLCGELTAWSVDERWRIRSEERLAWRRSAALAVLALSSLALAALVVGLSAAPANQGLLLTIAGAAAAVGAAGTGIWVARC